VLRVAVAWSCSGDAASRFVVDVPLQRVTSLRRRAQANVPAASYWLRRVVDELVVAPRRRRTCAVAEPRTDNIAQPAIDHYDAVSTFHDDDFCSAPAVWNSLPLTVLSSDSVAVFKSRLKTFLFSEAFSSFSAH